MTRLIERGIRTAYKSEDRIEEGSDEKIINLIKSFKHESTLEHGSITVKVITDRGVTHELVRHRIASFTQESTRYCVAGTTKLTSANPHVHLTLAEFFAKRQSSKNGAWKRLKFKQLNEITGELCYSTVNEVFFMGVKPTITIETKLGYKITLTKDHKVYTDRGYLKAGDLCLSDLVQVNGTDLLYRNKDWLFHQYNTLNKTSVDIETEFGFNKSTIKKWVDKHDLPKKPASYWNKGREPWNKGMSEHDDTRILAQATALRELHWQGGNPTVLPVKQERIKKVSKSTYQHLVKSNCEICGTTESLLVHHIDENRENNSLDNLITLCTKCHQQVHSKNLQVTHLDPIISITDAGDQDVYDISMNSEDKNFIGNGIVLHNCNYSKGKFGGSITVIEPFFFTSDIEKYRLWSTACEASEALYLQLLEAGAKAQEARSVLPNSLKTEIVVTANVREWRKIMELRTSKEAHPQIRQIMCPLLAVFREKWRILFDDVGSTEHTHPAIHVISNPTNEEFPNEA
jgi:thymidylate synthase ThyX